MNASASTIPREDQVQSKIRKVRAFGGNARVVCAALFWLALIGIVIVPLIAIIARTGTDVAAGVVPSNVPSPNSGNGGTLDVLQALLTPLQLMVCVFLVMGVVIVVARGLMDASVAIDLDLVFPSLSQMFSSFATAGLVLLASWIMDIGLYEKDHADVLQRDAELTI